jgi:hypothetical protein
MRVLGSIVQVPARPMLNIGKYRSLSDTIAAEPVSDKAPWLVLQTMQQPLEKSLGSRPAPPFLHQDVQHNAMLIHCAPQIVRYALDADKHLIEVPCIAGLRSTTAQSPGEIGTELQAPVPDALVGHRDATLGQDQLDVTQAETEHVIQPDCMTDDLGRKPMPGIRSGLECHAVSLAYRPPKRQPRLTWQCHLQLFTWLPAC